MNWIFNYIILYIMYYNSGQDFRQKLRNKNIEVYNRIKTEWFDQPDTVFEDIINGLRQETINMNYGSNSNDERRAIEQPIFNDTLSVNVISPQSILNKNLKFKKYKIRIFKQIF